MEWTKSDLKHAPSSRKQVAFVPHRAMNGDGTVRAAIKPGMRVSIVQKHDQISGKATLGIVKDILTKSATHPHGIKVRLETGEIGRVKSIVHDGVSKGEGSN